MELRNTSKSEKKTSSVRHRIDKEDSSGVQLKSAVQFGLETEIKVLKDLEIKNCNIIGHRIKTPFAEVDILFRSSKGALVLLEVKSLSKWVWLESRVTKKQSDRLKRAAAYIENRYNESVQICMAYVIQNKIFYLALEA